MIRVAISVEGPTEREFCNSVLSPFFYNHNIILEPVVITTSKEKCGRKNSGGCVNIDRVKNEVKKLLPSYDYVTTLYDFYGFKGLDEDISVEELESKLYELFNTSKFVPYIQKYEFETLLFSHPEYFEELFGTKLSQAIQKVTQEFAQIEDINNSQETAPSKRLIKIFESHGETYDKVFYGAAITQDIGLTTIRERAKRFNAWIEKIKNLGKSS
jgi:hypothetical protein